MSQYGTHPEWESGWESGVAETHERYEPLVLACRHLLELWAQNKNLTVPAQAIHEALESLPGGKHGT
jgi:hypothetical protein